MRGRLLVIWLSCTMLCTIAVAQNVHLDIHADKQKILIGEPLTLQLSATASKSSDIEWFTIDSIYHFEILNRSKIDTQLNGNEVELKQRYTITSWDSGRWQLPSFHMTGSNKTKPVLINVAYTPFDPKKDYHDIKDIIEVKPPARTTWYWYIIGAALLLVLFWLLFPQKKQKVETPKPVSTEGAYKDAMLRLEQLKKQQADEDVKRYYTTLIDIFRDYLYKRKNIQSFSKTTEDLAEQIKTLHLPANSYQALVPALQLSDMVKFAKYHPQPEENKIAWETIKNTIVTIENAK